MSRTRPFLFGATLGASAMFFSLQFHVLRTDSGFKVLPRTPQQSLGLTYSDIRGWPADRWQDRPELARAILANGSGELIADSVAGSLRDTLTENTATLDELRGFLDRTRPRSRNSPRPEDNTFVRTEKPVVESTAEQNNKAIPFSAVTPRPLPAGKTPADPFRKASTPEKTSRFSDTDVQQSLTGSDRKSPLPPPPAGAARPAASPENPAAALIRQQAEELEKRIFGDSSDTESTAPRSGLPPQTSTLPVFEEVTASLDEQARALLEDARQMRVASVADNQQTASGEPAKAAASMLQKVAENAAAALTEFVRSPAPDDQQQPAPAADTEDELPPAGFDPFLE